MSNMSADPVPLSEMPACILQHYQTCMLGSFIQIHVFVKCFSIRQEFWYMLQIDQTCLRNSYTMGCPSVRGDNPRALASRLSYVQVDNPWYNYFIPPISVLTLHIMRYFVLKLVRVV